MELLKTDFQRIAQPVSDEETEAQITSPGIEGMYVFLAGVFAEGTIKMQDVRRGYEEMGWSQERSLVLVDVEKIAEFLQMEKDTADSEADAMQVDKEADLLKKDEAADFARACKELSLIHI